MYKRIILLTAMAVLLTLGGLFVIKKLYMVTTKSVPTPTPVATVPPEVLQKFNENYPDKSLFPYRSINLTADYGTEPKVINITLKKDINHTVAISEIDSYLKIYNESVVDLESKGVKFAFKKIDSNNPQNILD